MPAFKSASSPRSLASPIRVKSVKTTKMVPLDLIDIPPRLRPVDPSAVEMIAAGFEESGQKQSILLRPKGDRYELVAGAHRMGAARLIEWKDIRADIEEMTDDQARLAEIDENLMRRELNPLDRAIFLFQRKAIYERLHPETAHGKAPKSKVERLKAEAGGEKSQSLRLFMPARFTAEAAEKIGLSERAIQLAISIAEGLSPKTIEALRGTALEGNQQALLALSQIEPKHQVEAVKLVASGEKRTLNEALVQVGVREQVIHDRARFCQETVLNLLQEIETKKFKRAKAAIKQWIEENWA